ncbi:MAG TPA: alpha/beta-hydrolase family protein [Mycobacteriales bacterium]|jgi:uncharacterized membrane protein
MWTDPARAASPDIGVNVGLLVASAAAPGTFASSLAPRSTLDQGLVTALSTGLHYLLTLGAQDMLQALAELATGPGRTAADQLARQHKLTLIADLAAVPLGFGLQRALPTRPGEPVLRGLLRQAGWRFAVTGLGGAVFAGARIGADRVDARLGGGGRIAGFPLAVPVGLAAAYLLERRRVLGVAEQDEPLDPVESAAPVRSLGLAAGATGALVGAAYAEHELATWLGRRLAAVLPGGPLLWRLAGHAACLGALTVASSSVWSRAMHRIEAGTSHESPIFGSGEDVHWAGTTMSGGQDSLVPWDTLGREGRRHVMAHVHPQPVEDRPAGVPDLSIETVMGEPAKASPIQVYVGLDSATTPRERVDLALAELERTGAFDRSVLMLVSPTGTGYVNYVAVAAAEYLTRGDIATVTLQYSKRPSPLSLGMVAGAREQNRLLWLRILDRLRESSGPRPRVVLFGESLGAHTSQDVFLHWGTLGLRSLGIDRALWIGTPYGSGWMHQLHDPNRLDVESDLVATVNDFGQLEDLIAERGSTPRYVLVSHDNDGVTKFGPDLLATAPTWLGRNRPRVEEVDGASPRGIPPAMRWRPITTFFQSLVDMKNAQAPGPFRAWAHDYRADLPRFISEVYELPASPEQMAAVEAALRLRESTREELFSPKAATDG